MKHLQLYEGFKLVDLGNSRWYGNSPSDSYISKVKDKCVDIIKEELKVSDKSFAMIDRVMDICDKTLKERDQEFDAIVHNSKQRNMRPQFAAESVYHTILMGRINALLERPFMMGGLKIEDEKNEEN